MEPLDEPAKAIPLVRKEGALSFEVKLTFIIYIALSSPIASCFLLASKPTVQYLFGDWILYTIIVIVAWIFMCHFAIVYKALPIRLAPIFVVILPCALLAIVAQVQAWQFSGQGAMLTASDCQSFEVKVRLETAWLQAQELFTNCTQNLATVTGASVDEIAQVITFEECPGYQAKLPAYGHEWQYLKHLEKTYRCGGWCNAHLPLWEPQWGESDSCSSVAGRSLTQQISLLGMQVTAYSGILLLTCSLGLLAYPQWMTAL